MDSTRAAGRRLPSLFERDGLENEDWFGWSAQLLAPCDGTVLSVETNEIVNRPGELPARNELTPASEVRFDCGGGLRVLYAHVRDIAVAGGDHVRAGQVVAKVSNNGVSSAPHVHLGAWRGDTPLQIRFDLRTLGDLRRER